MCRRHALIYTATFFVTQNKNHKKNSLFTHVDLSHRYMRWMHIYNIALLLPPSPPVESRVYESNVYLYTKDSPPQFHRQCFRVNFQAAFQGTKIENSQKNNDRNNRKQWSSQLFLLVFSPSPRRPLRSNAEKVRVCQCICSLAAPALEGFSLQHSTLRTSRVCSFHARRVGRDWRLHAHMLTC